MIHTGAWSVFKRARRSNRCTRNTIAIRNAMNVPIDAAIPYGERVRVLPPSGHAYPFTAKRLRHQCEEQTKNLPRRNASKPISPFIFFKWAGPRLRTQFADNVRMQPARRRTATLQFRVEMHQTSQSLRNGTRKSFRRCARTPGKQATSRLPNSAKMCGLSCRLGLRHVHASTYAIFTIWRQQHNQPNLPTQQLQRPGCTPKVSAVAGHE